MSDKPNVSKPCPWCGAGTKLYFDDDFPRVRSAYIGQIVCDKCGAAGPMEQGANKETVQQLAELAWDGRV